MAAEGCKTVFLVRKWACKCRLMLLLQLFTERLLMNLVKGVVTESGSLLATQQLFANKTVRR